MATFVAVYDACVLYPASLRSLLMHLPLTGRFRARWTDLIHDEWIASVLSDRNDIRPEALQRTRELMNRAVPDCLVTGYEGLIEQLELPDPDDRHVLAAAIRCQAGVIVTFNLKDFPTDALAPFGIDAQHPDEFICNLLSLDATAVCAAVRDQRQALTNPVVAVREMLDGYLANQLAGTVAILEGMQEVL